MNRNFSCPINQKLSWAFIDSYPFYKFVEFCRIFQIRNCLLFFNLLKTVTELQGSGKLINISIVQFCPDVLQYIFVGNCIKA